MPLTTRPEDLELYERDGDHFIHVLDHLFAPAVDAAGYDLVKPIMQGADLIHAEIVRNLEVADLVLCDISRHNPNVFFELGIRTALDRPIALVRDTTTDRLPFDTSGINTHTYNSALSPWTLDGEVQSLAAHIRASATSAGGSNPLWNYFGLTKRAAAAPESADPVAARLDLILARLGDLDYRQQELETTALSGLSAGRPIRTQGDAIPYLPAYSGSDGMVPIEVSDDVAHLLVELAEIAYSDYGRIRFIGIHPANEGDSVVIDSGNYVLSREVVEMMAARAAGHGYKLFYLGEIREDGAPRRKVEGVARRNPRS